MLHFSTTSLATKDYCRKISGAPPVARYCAPRTLLHATAQCDRRGFAGRRPSPGKSPRLSAVGLHQV
jgi:hypothetical protein